MLRHNHRSGGAPCELDEDPGFRTGSSVIDQTARKPKGHARACPWRRRSPRLTVWNGRRMSLRSTLEASNSTGSIGRSPAFMFESGPTILTRFAMLLIDVTLRWQGSLARPRSETERSLILVMMSGLSAWPGLQFAAGLHGLIVVPVNLKLEPRSEIILIEKTSPGSYRHRAAVCSVAAISWATSSRRPMKPSCESIASLSHAVKPK